MLKHFFCSFAIIVIFAACVRAQDVQLFRLWAVDGVLLEAAFDGFWNSDGTSTNEAYKDARSGVRLKTRQGKIVGIGWRYVTTEDRAYLKEIYQLLVPESDASVAVRLGDYENAKKLLLQEYNNKTLHKEGNNLVFFAAEGGNPDVIDLLNNNKFKINTKNKSDETPLHLAAHCGQLAMVIHLVEKYQLNINAKTVGQYQTPLYYAAHKGHVSVAKYLVGCGADILSFQGQNASIRTFGLPQTLSDRIFGEAHIQAPPGYLLLCVAAESGNPEMVHYLIENGANIKNDSGETILQYAQRYDLRFMPNCEQAIAEHLQPAPKIPASR